MSVLTRLFILAALAGASFTLVIKKHYLAPVSYSWSEAWMICKRHFIDLSVIDSLEEYNRFKTHVGGSLAGWIGLSSEFGAKNYSHWSDGTVLDFTMWSSEPKGGTYNCVMIKAGEWIESLCELREPFFCYSKVILVEEMMTWGEALRYCRSHYTDMFSVTMTTDQLVVNTIHNKTGSSFWTGLRFHDGSWYWTDRTALGTLVSLPSCPKSPLHCGAHDAAANIWENRNCGEKMFFACHVGR